MGVPGYFAPGGPWSRFYFRGGCLWPDSKKPLGVSTERLPPISLLYGRAKSTNPHTSQKMPDRVADDSTSVELQVSLKILGGTGEGVANNVCLRRG